MEETVAKTAERAPDKRDAQAEDVPERRYFRVLLAIAILTSLASLAVCAVEYRGLPKGAPYEERSGAMKPVLPPVVKPSIKPLEFLPDQILQYTTKARHAIPGSTRPAAEGIYETADMNLILAMPMNTYVKVTYFPSRSEAVQDVSSTLSGRYPLDNRQLPIGGAIAQAGYSRDEGSYFIGWAHDAYSIKLFTSFTNSVPAAGKGKLEDHALPVAKAVEEATRKKR